MFAAASGHSTLGIPKSVGEDFVAADKERGKSDFTKAMQHHGAAKGAGDHKRHPATNHYVGPKVDTHRYGKVK
jgi:hypothetical protein